MQELDLFLKNPSGFNWSSLNITEWTGKLHKNVLRDIEEENKQLGEKGKLIFEPSFYMTNGKTFKMFLLNKRGVMQLATRYDANVRFQLLSKVEELTDKLTNLKLHRHHADTYKQCMEIVYKLCPKEDKETIKPACKSATVVNKIVSTIFGFDKLIKKPDMTPEMLTIRIQVQSKYEEVFELTNGDNSLTTDMLYGLYVPVLMEDRLKKNLKKLEKTKKELN